MVRRQNSKQKDVRRMKESRVIHNKVSVSLFVRCSSKAQGNESKIDDRRSSAERRGGKREAENDNYLIVYFIVQV